ncbi:unnamed protein product [Meganyctiphanes norvegica]|uniref:C2H2-type domain-containing protein n=1 Tax=Meganyctiphanes norvegica TaxID=48144 RepID=A0AAV2QCJ4_MEGNR
MTMFAIDSETCIPNIQIYPQHLEEERDICIIIGDADSSQASEKQGVGCLQSETNYKEIKKEQLNICDYNTILNNIPRNIKEFQIPLKSKKQLKNVFTCSLCGDPFSNISSVKRHQKNCGKESLRKKMICFHPTCKRRYHKMIELLHHIERVHDDMKLEISEHAFKNLEEFNSWREMEEVTTHAKYTRQGGKNKNSSGTHYSYVCQNSGTDRGKRLTNRKHKKGKVKIGAICPARLLVQESNNGSINVRYIATHNHSVSIQNTQYQSLPKSVINFITNQLALGISEKIIRNDLIAGIRDQLIFELDGTPVIRKQIVTERYIKQLGLKNNVTARLSREDAEAIDILVHKLDISPYSPILTYKPQDRSLIIGAAELDHLPHSKDLFAIGLQTMEQRDILQKSATRVLCVDTTHCQKTYEFDLFSLIIPDEYGKGFPIAYFVTNYRDEVTLRYLFSSLKKHFTGLVIDAVITDDSLRGLNSYKALLVCFRKAKHLLCQTFIQRNWKYRLKSMVKGNIRLQNEIQTYLDELLQETNIQKFKKLCEDLFNNYCSLTFIKEYMCNKYLNKAELWAKCYRVNFSTSNTDSIPNCRILNGKLKAYFKDQTPNRRVSGLVSFLVNFWCSDSIEPSGNEVTQYLVEERDDVCIILDDAGGSLVSNQQGFSSLQIYKNYKVTENVPVNTCDYNKFSENIAKSKKDNQITLKSNNILMKKPLTCGTCGDPFSNMSSVKRHQKNCGKESLRKKMICFHPTCKRKYHKMIELLHHIERAHDDMKLETSEHDFKNFEEFNSWRTMEEVTTHAKYTRQGGKTKNRSKTHYSYVCQNSGTDRGKRLTNRKHKKGKVKTGAVCPARILVQESNNGSINVRYIATHNHSVSIQNTQYQSLPKSVINFITNQLALGFSEKNIHKDLVEGIMDESIFDLDGTPVIRKQIVTERYIKQLGIKNHVTAQLSREDAEAINFLIHKLDSSPYNPILTYKPQGRSLIIGAEELDRLPHSKDLFAIGIQTKEQRDILQKSDARVLCVDTTHCRKPYEFDLISIIIPDEYGKGYPVAYFVTNYRDEITLRYLFSSLKQHFSGLAIDVVITDDSLRGLNSYKAFSVGFGKPKHFLCHTLIQRNWKYRLKSVVKGNVRLQNEIQTYLDEMLQETNIQNFQKICNKLSSNYCSLTFIKEYMCKKYFNRAELWAKCYRVDFHTINTDSIPICKILNGKLKAYFKDQSPYSRVSDLVSLLINFWCSDSFEVRMENKLSEKV